MPVMRQRRVVILGSTGSIGTSALKVSRDIPDRMKVVGLAAATSIETLAQQAKETGVKRLAIFDPQKADALKQLVDDDVEIFTGEEGLCELARTADADMVLISIVGTAGLRPALEAIRTGKDLAIASKEILVMAGKIVMAEAKAAGVSVLPVDSEHNAIYQCLQVNHRGTDQISRIILTASGGPFRTWEKDQLNSVTIEQALNHPTWSMGKKITVDSATLFNKGLEMIEAKWLFDLPMSKVDVIIQPQSIVHSMVEFIDGSIIAQMSESDMCFPIQYAVTWPDRVSNSLKPLNLAQLGNIVFEQPRYDAFPALNLARKAGEICGTMPAVFNAANEIAVAAFFAHEIGFSTIWEVVARVMDEHESVDPAGKLEPILAADQWARTRAQAVCRELTSGNK